MIVCVSDIENYKFYLDLLLKGLEIFGRELYEVFYVGDFLYDMKCVYVVGVYFGLVFWGVKIIDGFEKVEFVFEKLEDILVYVSK